MQKLFELKILLRMIFYKSINLNEIDAVITGEGSFDFQSFEGKGAGIILKLFAKRNIPIFLINGSTNLPPSIKLPENVFTINLIDLFIIKRRINKKLSGRDCSGDSNCCELPH